MAIRQKCLYCGEPVSTSGYCTVCKLYQPFMKKALNTSAYHYNIGLARAKARDLSGAVESLLTSLRYNKMNIQSRNLLGLVYYEMGEVVPALGQWVLSVNYQPEKNSAVRYLKEIRDDHRELERANEVARQFNQALEHAKQHSLDLAVIPLKKAVSMNMKFVKGHLLMALIYLQQNRRGMAKKHLSQVLSIDRTNVTAQRILREMGEKEEAITRLAEQGEEAAAELFSYYGVETTAGGRPARKIEPVRTPGTRRSNRMGRFREASRARFSNLYMFTGIVIGILILFFLLLPGIRKNAAGEAESKENSYLKELSARNAEIAGLQLSVEEAEKKVEQVNREKDELNKQIESLGAQIEALRSQIASGGASNVQDAPQATTEEETEETTEDPEGGNAAGDAGDPEDGNVTGDAGDPEGGNAAGDSGDPDTDNHTGETAPPLITAQEIEAMISQE